MGMFFQEFRKMWGRPRNLFCLFAFLALQILLTWQCVPPDAGTRMQAYKNYAGQMTPEWKKRIQREYTASGMEKRTAVSTKESVLAEAYVYCFFHESIERFLESLQLDGWQKQYMERQFADLLEHTEELRFNNSHYYYARFMKSFYYLPYFMAAMLLVITADIVSAERKYKMDALLAVSRDGTDKHFQYKWLLCVTSGGLVFLLFAGLTVAVLYVRMGGLPALDGFVQDMLTNFSPYRWSLGRYLLTHLLTALFVILVLDVLFFYIALRIREERWLYLVLCGITFFPMMLFSLFRTVPLALYVSNFAMGDYLWDQVQIFSVFGVPVPMWQIAAAELTVLFLLGVWLSRKEILKGWCMG